MTDQSEARRVVTMILRQANRPMDLQSIMWVSHWNRHFPIHPSPAEFKQAIQSLAADGTIVINANESIQIRGPNKP